MTTHLRPETAEILDRAFGLPRQIDDQANGIQQAVSEMRYACEQIITDAREFIAELIDSGIDVTAQGGRLTKLDDSLDIRSELSEWQRQVDEALDLIYIALGGVQ